MTNRPENVYSYMFTGLLALQAIILFYWAATMPIASAYEGEIMRAAAQMVKSGNWFMPRLADHKVVYHTPILAYWLAAAGHVLFPKNLIGFRLLNILFYLPAFWGFFVLSKKYLDARTAFFSCCILVSSLAFTWQMQLATPDGPAAIFFCGALAGFYLILKTNDHKFFWLLYGCLAAGLLIKGLVSLLLPLLIMMVYLMFKIKMNGAVLKKLLPGKGFLLLLLLCVPWYLYAGIQEQGNWLSRFWTDYHWQQYFSDNPQAEGAFYMPFLYLILMMLPFGIFLPLSFSYSWKYRIKKDLLLLSLLSIILILLFYAFSGTFYPHYLLAALPLSALAIGYRFSSKAGRSLLKMGMNVEIGIMALLAILIPFACWYILKEDVEGNHSLTLLFIFLLAILPLGTMGTGVLWANKRTDDGMTLLAISYLLFSAILVYFAQINNTLSNYLDLLVY